MKKLFIIAGLLSLAACSNDEGLFDPNAGGENPSGIEGTWKLTSMTVETPVDIDGDGESGTDLMVETNCYQNETLVFNADLTGQQFSTSYLSLSIEGSFPDDVTFTTECVEEEETTDFAWLQNENQITLMLAEMEPQNATLEGDTLTITIPNGQIYMDDEFNVVLEEDLTMVYTKQP